jgi:hypothetical protein
MAANIRPSLVPLTYSNSFPFFWKGFVESITSELWLQHHFLKCMQMFKDEFDQAVIIDHDTINSYLQNLCSPFPVETHKEIADKFNELIHHYVPKLTLDNFRPMIFETFTTDDKGQKAKPNYSNLAEIFVDGYFEICLAVLKRNKIIDPAGTTFLGVKKEKAAIAAWIMIIKTKQYIKEITYPQLAGLLNKQFTGLEINERTLRERTTYSYNDYFNKFIEEF